MEVAMEDDLFFADLNKQISLLIMDDDEEPLATSFPLSFQGFSKGNYPQVPTQTLQKQNFSPESSRGTGVFIPRSWQPKRKDRQRKFSSYNTKTQHYRPQQQHDTTTMLSQISSYSNNNNSVNPQKG